jgi:HEPN domain-containing protein
VKRDEIIRYWLDLSDVDYQAMGSLFKSGHYVWALFIAHLVVEKILKAYYVKKVDGNVPLIHDLLKIAEKANLELTEERKDFLDEVTTFNIKSRYPDYKNRFYRKATREFAENYINQIKEFRTWLIKKINI